MNNPIQTVVERLVLGNAVSEGTLKKARELLNTLSHRSARKVLGGTCGHYLEYFCLDIAMTMRGKEHFPRREAFKTTSLSFEVYGKAIQTLLNLSPELKAYLKVPDLKALSVQFGCIMVPVAAERVLAAYLKEKSKVIEGVERLRLEKSIQDPSFEYALFFVSAQACGASIPKDSRDLQMSYVNPSVCKQFMQDIQTTCKAFLPTLKVTKGQVMKKNDGYTSSSSVSTPVKKGSSSVGESPSAHASGRKRTATSTDDQPTSSPDGVKKRKLTGSAESTPVKSSSIKAVSKAKQVYVYSGIHIMLKQEHHPAEWKLKEWEDWRDKILALPIPDMMGDGEDEDSEL